MKLIGDQQCLEWIDENVLKFPSKSDVPIQKLRKKAKYVKVFVVPFKPDYYLVLASNICKWFEYNTAMFYISFCSGSEIGEHAVFQSIEERFGISQALIKDHNLYFEQKNQDNTIAIYDIIICLLCFNWEGYLFSDSQETFVWFADEVIEIHTASGEKARKIQDLLDTLRIKTIKQ